MSTLAPTRLAIVVTHPIQYYAPLYRALAARPDLEVRVFFTLHGGDGQAWDAGFAKAFAWDIPLLEGYESQVVPNVAKQPSSDNFWGVQNPELIDTVLGWRPDVVLLTGYSYLSHLQLLRALARRRVPVLFRGDSHLLGQRSLWKRAVRRAMLSWIYRWPTIFLDVGQHNREYYRHFGVPEAKFVRVPHCIEVERFAEPNDQHEAAAAAWRRELGIAPDQIVVLFAGKFQPKKQPLELMRAVAAGPAGTVVVMVGDGPLASEVQAFADQHPGQFRVLPFQNQSKMPIVYRLGDLFVLPSRSAEETWGLAVNEALACGRVALVSDQVGCAPDLIESGVSGEVFEAGDWADFHRQFKRVLEMRPTDSQRRETLRARADRYSVAATAEAVVEAMRRVGRDLSSKVGQ